MERSDLYQVPGNLPLSLMESLTFAVRQSSNQSTFNSYTVGRILRRKVSDEEKMQRGLLNVKVIRFRVPQISLNNAVAIGGAPPPPAPPPKPRDRFTDSTGAVWTITDGGVDSPLLGYYHDCLCQANPG